MATRKGFDPAGNKVARDLVRMVIKDKGGQPQAAKAIGVAQGYLSDFIHGNRGGGGKILRGLARLYPERALELIGAPPSAVTATTPSDDVVERELASTDALKLQKRFLPSLEERYPGLGLPALRGLRSRPKLRSFDLSTCWEALASVRFEERGVAPTSLDLMRIAQATLLDEGEPLAEEPPRRTPKRNS